MGNEASGRRAWSWGAREPIGPADLPQAAPRGLEQPLTLRAGNAARSPCSATSLRHPAPQTQGIPKRTSIFMNKRGKWSSLSGSCHCTAPGSLGAVRSASGWSHHGCDPGLCKRHRYQRPLPQLMPAGPPLCFQAQALGIPRGAQGGQEQTARATAPRAALTASRDDQEPVRMRPPGPDHPAVSAPTLPRWDVAPSPLARDTHPPHPPGTPASSSINHAERTHWSHPGRFQAHGPVAGCRCSRG